MLKSKTNSYMFRLLEENYLIESQQHKVLKRWNEDRNNAKKNELKSLEEGQTLGDYQAEKTGLR